MSEETKPSQGQEANSQASVDLSTLLPIIVPEVVKQVEEIKALVELNAKVNLAGKFMAYNPHTKKTEFDADGFTKAWNYLTEGYPVLSFEEDPAPVNGANLQEQ
jgi:hypothetical protein